MSMLEVKLAQPLKPEEVDDEIITVGGIDLGFIMAGDPPHVLSVEPSTELGKHGVQTHDILATIDGKDTRTVARSEVMGLLSAAKSLGFERAKGGDAAEAAQPSDVPNLEANAEEAEEPSSKRAKIGGGEAARAAATESPAAGVEMKTGMMVRLMGFSSTAMNGAKGRLGKYSEKQNSWQVFLDKETKAKAVKVKNLEVVIGSDGKPEWATGYEPAPAPAAPAAPADERGAAVAWAAAALQAAQAKAQASQGTTQMDVDKMLPGDAEHDGWVELLRDVVMKQLREAAEYPEPPTFMKAYDHAARWDQHPCPEGKFPQAALSWQAKMLTKHRQAVDGSLPEGRPPRDDWGYGGGGKGGGGKGWGGRWTPQYRQGKGGPKGGSGQRGNWAPKVVGPPPGGVPGASGGDGAAAPA